MQHSGHAQGEGGHRDIECRAIVGDHLVAAMHFAVRRGEHGAAGVFKKLAGLQQGLCPDYA